ncbi:MAG: bifunctional nuclease family protein [Actinobacteria bacterium]|nr:MAG: bifunctional nuclease family protein [Actinomycetota bacterium]
MADEGGQGPIESLQSGADGSEGGPEGEDGRQDGSVEPAPMRQTAFMEVVLELPSTHPAVVLHEIDPPRRELRITIAQPEGVAIAYAWRGITMPRPLTHDLLTTILQRFGLQVDAVRITGVEGPVFHAELALSGPSGSHTVECRPSDAIALALRQPLAVPIMVAEEVLAIAGRPLA